MLSSSVTGAGVSVWLVRQRTDRISVPSRLRSQISYATDRENPLGNELCPCCNRPSCKRLRRA